MLSSRKFKGPVDPAKRSYFRNVKVGRSASEEMALHLSQASAVAQNILVWTIGVSNRRDCFSGTRQLETPCPIKIIICTLYYVRETWRQNKITGDRSRGFVCRLW
jgi:hypothetical protein